MKGWRGVERRQRFHWVTAGRFLRSTTAFFAVFASVAAKTLLLNRLSAVASLSWGMFYHPSLPLTLGRPARSSPPRTTRPPPRANPVYIDFSLVRLHLPSLIVVMRQVHPLYRRDTLILLFTSLTMVDSVKRLAISACL